MANTEKIVILKQVREIEGTLTDALDKPGLTQGQRNALDDLSDVLQEIDKLILLNELNECIDDLKSNSKKLKNINGRIKRQIEGLEDISAKVEQVSKAIDAVVKAFGILIGAGVI
jgi:methyl-accepting chemotaxis protein